METYGLSPAIDVAKVSSIAREEKAEQEFTKFFEIVQGKVLQAANEAKTYVDFYIPTHEFEVIDITTSTTIKNVFKQQGYNVTINNPCYHGEEYACLLEISW